MVYQTVIKKKRFEEEGNIAIPQKNRPFKLKERMAPSVPNAPSSGAQEVRNTAQDKIQLLDKGFDSDTFPKMNARNGFVKGYTDETGLDQAYDNSSNLFLDKDRTLHVSGTKGGLFGPDWIENYKTMGAPLVANILGIPLPYTIEENKRYQELDNFMKLHPGEVKNFVGHSKGAAVVHTWMKNHPEFTGQSRIYSTPYEDFFGKDAIKTGLNNFKEEHNSSMLNAMIDEGEKIFELDTVQPVKGETRIANNSDFAAALDRSAERYDHGNPWKYFMSGGPHDYHEGVARFKSGFGEQKNAIANRPGTDIDKNYKNPFNLPNNYTWKTPASSEPQGTKTTWQNPDGTTSITQ